MRRIISVIGRSPCLMICITSDRREFSEHHHVGKTVFIWVIAPLLLSQFTIAVNHITASLRGEGLARAPGAGTDARERQAQAQRQVIKERDKRSAHCFIHRRSFSRITYSTVGILINLGTMGSSIFFFTALHIFSRTYINEVLFFPPGELGTSTQQ